MSLKLIYVYGEAIYGPKSATVVFEKDLFDRERIFWSQSCKIFIVGLFTPTSSNEQQTKPPTELSSTTMTGSQRLEDVLMFILRLLSVATLTTATLSFLGVAYYRIETDNRGRFERSLGYNCTEVAGTNTAAIHICNTNEVRSYNLWSSSDAYDVLSPSRGFCRENGGSLQSDFNTSSSLDDIGGYSAGECTMGILRVAQTFALLATIVAFIDVIWIIIIADQQKDRVRLARVHSILVVSTFITSMVVVIVYCTSISPLRLVPRYCEIQLLFERLSTCIEYMGPGFYLQVSTSALACTTLLICIWAYRKGFWGRRDDNCTMQQNQVENFTKNDTRRTDSSLEKADGENRKEKSAEEMPEEKQQQAPSGLNKSTVQHESQQHHQQQQHRQQQIFTQKNRRCCNHIHFWIRVGRIAEFLLILIGGLASFTDIHTTVPAGPSTPIPNVKDIAISSNIRLWDQIFCSSNLVWFTFIATNETSTFGDCDTNTLFHVQFATVKVLIGSSLALIFKRNARQNPFFYLIGVFMDLLSLVFIALAVGLFYAAIFPGRNEIDPPYCQSWQEQVGTDQCSVKLGAGYWIYCTILILITINFTGEIFLPLSERNQAYGAQSAIATVVRRVRQRRFRDLPRPQSVRLPNDSDP